MSDFIPGVYCYCDQWCDRCPLQARCAVFAGSAALDATGLDVESPEYWQKMMEQFLASHPEVPGDAIELVELRPPTEDERAAFEADSRDRDEYLRTQPLAADATALCDGAHAFLEDRDFWRARARRFADDAAMGIRSVTDCFADCDRVTEQHHRLHWYSGIAAGRIQTALLRLREAPMERDDAQTELNGSVKVALLALNECRGALAAFLELTGEEDRLLPLLGVAERMEQRLREAFPLAGQFIRPGFDEQPAWSLTA